VLGAAARCDVLLMTMVMVIMVVTMVAHQRRQWGSRGKFFVAEIVQ
jgi:type II secretory pathway component PulK